MHHHTERDRAKRRAETASPPEPTVVQPKLKVGSVDDPAEVEADRVAAEAVRRLAAGSATPERSGDDRVRRSTAGAAASGAAFEVSADVEERVRRAKSGGEPLAGDVRDRFEGAIGADLGNVRIHRSADADRLNSELAAEAFASGDHVFFSKGSYDPDSASGQHLLAHELAHTVQQSGAAQRTPIRRFAIGDPDFSKTTGVKVFSGGGSGNVAQFDDGGKPLIVKVDQLIGNEVVVAGNLHQAVDAKSDGFRTVAPGARLATPQEKAAIKAATLRCLAPGDNPRNFVTGLDSDKPTVIMEKGSGVDFEKVLQNGGHTKKRMGKTVANNKSIVFQMVNRPGPLNTLGQSTAVDVMMGMGDRVLQYYNPQNFMYDDEKQTFSYVDNTQNGPGGFITTVKMTTGDDYTSEESFNDWARDGQRLASDPAGIARQLVSKLTQGMQSDLEMQQDPAAPLFEKAVAKNQAKMEQWATDGVTASRDIIMAALANPLALLSGIDPAKRQEAGRSMLAKYYVLRGLAPAQAWKAAGIQIQRLLEPKTYAKPTPWKSAQPTGKNGAQEPEDGKSSTPWKSAQPSGKWKSAQPTGKWKSAQPSAWG